MGHVRTRAHAPCAGAACHMALGITPLKQNKSAALQAAPLLCLTHALLPLHSRTPTAALTLSCARDLPPLSPGGPTLFRDLNFGLDLDSRLAIVGPNGIGKSTLLNLICGQLEATSGLVQRNSKVLSLGGEGESGGGEAGTCTARLCALCLARALKPCHMRVAARQRTCTAAA